MIRTFIIVLNWNQPKLTIETVDSLQKLKVDKKNETRIVIVDNGSSDNSVEMFRQMKSAKFGVEVMEAGVNLGFAGGNNLGIKYAIDRMADFVMVINNDVEVDKNVLSALLAPMKDKKVAITSPKIYFARGYEFRKYSENKLGKVLWYAGGKIDWKNVYGINVGVDEVDKEQHDKEREIDFATGACFLVRVEVLKEIGLFDEKYFMYMEDVDLSVRTKKRGYKILYVPTAFIKHKVAQSSGIGSDLNDYFIARNRLVFGLQYANLRAKLALIRESVRLFVFGRYWQAVGIRDFYLRRYGKGSWGK